MSRTFAVTRHRAPLPECSHCTTGRSQVCGRMAPYHYRGCPCSQCWKRQNRLAQRLVNVVGVMSQQPNYSQLAMSEDSWDPISKAAAASVALNAFNGYPRQTALPNVGYPAPGSNGGHYPAGPQSHAPQLSPTAGGRGNGSSGTVAQHWHGIRLPTAPSSSSGTITATADGWLSAALPQNISGMNPSSTVITPSSNAAAAAAAAAQAYSGNTTSYFATGGGEAGISHPSVLPPTRPPPPAGQTAPAVLSPTSPMISPTAPLATVWPQSSHSDSILPGQHNHRFQLPQQNHQSEQRSPQRHQHQHSVGLVHGLNDKTLPHYQQHPAHTHQQYPNFGTATGSANSPTMAAVSYEKLLEAVAIQAARVPFFNQQTSLGSHHHQIEPQRTDGTENQQSSIMELDILRNLAATAGNASSGYTNASHHGPRNQQEQQQPGGVLGTNGYGRSSFRPPVTIKQEPSYTSITPPGTIATPSSDLDVAHTMLSIQTCSIQNTVPEYQQISPPADAPQPETKYQPPSSTNSNSAMSPRKGSSGGGDNDEERKAYAAAITVETSQSDTYGESGQQPMAKRLKISTSTEDVSKSNEEDPIGTGDNADSDHSNANAQGEQAKNDNENGRDHSDTAKKTPTPPTSCSGGFGEDVSPVVSRSSPSNDTPLSVGGRTDSSSENDSPSGVGAAATATAVSFVRSNILVPTLSSENSSPVAATVTTSAATTNPPGHFPPTPFGAFAGQQHSGNYTNLHTCHICGFSSPSKFHFNSHMNTHADHKCDYCDYTSRTEGRLKRHMKEFHSPPHTSTANSNDESSSHGGGHNAGGNSSFDQSLEEQLQAVVANMTSGAGAGAMGNITKTPPPSKASTSGSGNKMKTYRCKQCEFVAKSKDDYWAHSRTHIKSDKLLVCPNCPFVTEYKHHLEYHLRNHFGSKPFKCVKCNYSCVNKSMLNSHMKSHSNVYQYRCTDCTYATKYCHSLKLHLRKYGHTAATTVTTEGSTLVDGMSIDVYGNRRGPRSKKSSGGGDNASTSSAEGNRTSVTTGGPLSASLPLASPSYLRTSAPSALEESLNQQRATAIVTPGGTGVVSTTPSFVEAFQSSLMAQQQKDLTAAMVTSIATLGAQLPTVPSLAAVIAAAQNRPGPPSTLPMGGMPNTEPVSPGPGPLLSTGHMGPACVLSSTLQMTSPPANAQPPQLLKCNLCEFACVSKEALTKHTMIHMIEKPEQFYHVLMASAAAQAQAVAAAAAAYANTSQQSVSGGSSCESTPAMADMGMGREMTTHMGGGAYGDGESDEQIGGRLQDASQDSGGSPCSVSGGKASGDEGIGNESLAGASTLSGGPSGQHRQRRKGKAFKLDRIALKLQGKECEEEENETTAGVGGEGDNENIAGGYDKIGTRHTRSTSPAGACYSGQSESGFRVNRSESVSSVGEGRPRVQRGNTRDESQPHVNAQQRKPSSSVYPSPMGRPTNIDWSNAYVCNYCEIAFKDCIMYTMHMGFHGYQDPYKCNTCGHVSDDARSMFLHIAREPHL